MKLSLPFSFFYLSLIWEVSSNYKFLKRGKYISPNLHGRFFENILVPKLHIGRHHPVKNKRKNGKEEISFDKLEKSIMKNVDSINVMFDPKVKKFIPSKSKKAHIVGKRIQYEK
ncbi:rhoptry neck protein 5, putative (RON5) [Plasmodium ovale curtisi]|uniref:Rhoptry neck protein 5, putative (RON5) n=1 Tax=Plasmodium ovale curtisi TaxID=864141 RepID=A0A1A8WR41_PLAOA|nr:rhoptry neck protein 5, putative (RON5) [Plasmodium ovale curtisi]